MDIFLFFGFLGGLAVFLFGMNTLSESLGNIGADKFEYTLTKITSNPFKAIALGAGVTAAAQSSSAVTVMLVGFTDAGIIEFENTIGVIVGANIGTTVTAWLMSTTAFKSDNFLLSVFKAENLAAFAAVFGIIPLVFSKRLKMKNTGKAVLGFSVLMYGMELMKNSVTPLLKSGSFRNLLTAFNNPLASLFIGALSTGIIQSSSASTGILQSVCSASALSVSAAVPIITGQNIGTCFTAFLSSIGACKNAKRVAAVHIAFNVLGAVLFLTLFYCFGFAYYFSDKPADPITIALIHTLFNIFSALVFMPFYVKKRGKLVMLHK